MVIYENTKAGFISDVENDILAYKLSERFQSNHIPLKAQEVASWQNSSQFVKDVLKNSNIDDDVSIYLEYQIPLMARRADFVIAGSDGTRNNIVVVELKQWARCERTGKDGIVRAYTGGQRQEVTHPSYQAKATPIGFALFVNPLMMRISAYSPAHIFTTMIQIISMS